MTKAKILHGCYEVGCPLAFSVEGEVREGIVKSACSQGRETFLAVDVYGKLYELYISDQGISVVEPIYQEAA